MLRSTFIKNLIGFYGISAIPAELVKQYQKVYLLQAFVRGFQYYKGPKLIKKMNATKMLELVRESDNEFDRKAIALYFNNQKIGYIPREKNKVLSVLMDSELLKLQAEITHLKPEAVAWENVSVAVYALKEVDKTNNNKQSYFNVLRTPKYYTINNNNNYYTRIDLGSKDKELPLVNYYQLLVQNSKKDGVYDLIHQNFPNPDDFEDAFNNAKIIYKKNSITESMNNLEQTIDDLTIDLESVFGENDYAIANVNEVAKIPSKIDCFDKITDALGREFYELKLKL